MRRLEVLLFFAAVAAVGCGSDEPVVLPVPASIEVSSGNGQSGPANTVLAQPLIVTVRDESGVPLPRVRVSWTISPGGTVSALTATDVDGMARTFPTLGGVGEHVVKAAVTSDRSLAQQFTVTATDPPILTALVPTTFGPGDTVEAQGSNLVATAAEITVDEVPARVLSVTPSAVSFIAPSCVGGGIRPVVGRFGLAVTDPLNATFQAGADSLDLAVGEFTVIEPSLASTCARFPAVGGQTVEYAVVALATTSSTGRLGGYRVSGGAIPTARGPTTTAHRPRSAAHAFHDELRQMEFEWSVRNAARPFRGPAVSSLRLVAAPKVGTTRSFRVCGSVTAGSGCEPFQEVTAVARFVGERAAIYIDEDAPATLSEQDLSTLGAVFDERLYGIDSRAFGSESDIDANGVVVILMTNAVNRLTEESNCEDGFIAGFFFGFDIVPSAQTNPNSNKGEVFYTLVADPQGTISCDHSIERIRRLVPVTFVHEFQHMISFNQHVLIRGGTAEVVWLNEALSQFAEELAGRSFLDEGDNATFSRFAINNLLNAFRYLSNPNLFFLLAPDTSLGTLEERGAGSLFMRWLVDQFGPDVTRSLVETDQRSVANVEAATGVPFRRLVSEWALAIWGDDLPGFSPTGRLTLPSWNLRTTYGALNQDEDPEIRQEFNRPFPIVPANFTEGLAVAVTGTLRSGSPNYITLALPPGTSGFALTLTDGGGGILSADLAARLLVIRTR